MVNKQQYVEAFNQIIEAINEMIESIGDNFKLLDFNSRYMMERGMRMALIEVKKKSVVFQSDPFFNIVKMSSKEAADYIREYLVEDNIVLDQALDLAYCALQKQTPKRPLHACGHAVEHFRESIPCMNYCPICGQRIDWEGEEDE